MNYYVLSWIITFYHNLLHFIIRLLKCFCSCNINACWTEKSIFITFCWEETWKRLFTRVQNTENSVENEALAESSCTSFECFFYAGNKQFWGDQCFSISKFMFSKELEFTEKLGHKCSVGLLG